MVGINVLNKKNYRLFMEIPFSTVSYTSETTLVFVTSAIKPVLVAIRFFRNKINLPGLINGICFVFCPKLSCKYQPIIAGITNSVTYKQLLCLSLLLIATIGFQVE